MTVDVRILAATVVVLLTAIATWGMRSIARAYWTGPEHVVWRETVGVVLINAPVTALAILFSWPWQPIVAIWILSLCIGIFCLVDDRIRGARTHWQGLTPQGNLKHDPRWGIEDAMTLLGSLAQDQQRLRRLLEEEEISTLMALVRLQDVRGLQGTCDLQTLRERARELLRPEDEG